MDKNKSPESFGSDYCGYGMYPMIITANRINMLKNNIYYSKRLYDGQNGSYEEIYIDKNTNDIFKKISLNLHDKQQVDHYEALLSVDKQTTNPNGTYLAFEFRKLGLNDGRFENTSYRHGTNGKVEYIKTYTDEEISEMIQEYPSHPLLMLMNRTFDIFDGNKNMKKESTEEYQPLSAD